MRICWAAILGGCGGGFSGEHLLSKGLFTGKQVQVQGSPWRAMVPKSVGVNALTANILCRTHNSMLSTVDDEGIRAFRAIRRFEEIMSLRKPLTDATELQHEVYGPMLERWFIKHTINLFVVSKSTNRWSGGSLPRDPPQEIVEAAFGLVNLQSPRGLYNWAGQLGERRIVGDQIGFQPIFDMGGEYLEADPKLR